MSGVRASALGLASGRESRKHNNADGSNSASVSTNFRSNRMVCVAAAKSGRGPTAIMNSAKLTSAPTPTASARRRPSEGDGEGASAASAAIRSEVFMGSRSARPPRGL